MDDVPIKNNNNNPTVLRIFFYGGVVTSLFLGVLTFYLTSKESFKNKSTTMQVVVGLPINNEISRSITDGVELSIGQNTMINGKRVEIVSIDTGNTEGIPVVSKEINAAKQSAENENVVAYIGPLTAGAADVVIPELNKGYLFNIMPIASASYVTKSGYRNGYPRLLYPTNFRSLARVSPSVDMSVRGVYEFAESISSKKTLIIRSNGSSDLQAQKNNELLDADMVTDAEFVQKMGLSQYNVIVVITEFGSPLGTDIFHKLLTFKKQQNISVIFNQTYDDTNEIIEFSKIFEGTTYVVSSFLDASLIKEYKTDFYNAFIDVYGYDPDKYAYAGYDSAQLVLEVLSKTSLPSRGSYLRTLSSLRMFNGATGVVPINEFGDLRNNKIMVYKIISGVKYLEKEYLYEQ